MLTICSLLVMAAGSGYAIFSTKFHDTLLQRFALSGICLGCVSMAWWSLFNDVPDPLEWISVCGALYVVSTAWKFRHIELGMQ
jgi:hypothetical protein